MEEIIYFDRIGAENLRLLIKDFYSGVASSKILRKMYPMNLEPAEERLFWFMQQYLGGPRTYNEKRGLPQLRKRHFPFPVNKEAREEWISLMFAALEKNPMDDLSKVYLKKYFADTATFLINRNE